MGGRVLDSSGSWDTTGGLLWTWWGTLGLHKVRGISRVYDELSACQESLRCWESVTTLPGRSRVSLAAATPLVQLWCHRCTPSAVGAFTGIPPASQYRTHSYRPHTLPRTIRVTSTCRHSDAWRRHITMPLAAWSSPIWHKKIQSVPRSKHTPSRL
jgi:hypothetical protein